MKLKTLLLIFMSLILACVVLFALLQVIPYGRTHTNPPIVKEPNWDSPQTRQFAQRACFDCHSNEVVYPWYSNVAPVSWLVQRDVDEGRRRLNFSDWGNRNTTINELSNTIMNGEMPPFQYMPMHPTARLSVAEKEAFLRGLSATLNQ
jgi:cytochrome c551/c552